MAHAPGQPRLRLVRLEAFGFAIGSVLFATGALTAQFAPDAAQSSNLQFMIGALFFTAAAAIQGWLAHKHQAAADGAWQVKKAIRNPDWLSSVVQFLGTLYFNAMTIRAFVEPYVSQHQANHAVWRPDMIGSSLFLISSIIAWSPVSRQRRHSHVQRRSIWICQANLYGSIGFGIAAVAGFYTADGQLLDPAVANWATFAGGAFFFIGAVLLLPRWSQPPT